MRTFLVGSLAALGLATSPVAAAPQPQAALYADATWDGPGLVLVGVGNRESDDGSSGPIARFTLHRPRGARVIVPPRGRSLGTLEFVVDMPDRSVRQERVPLRVVRRYTRGLVLGDARGAQVTLRPALGNWLQVRLPAGAREPALRLQGPGAHLLRFAACEGQSLEPPQAGQAFTDRVALNAYHLRRTKLCS